VKRSIAAALLLPALCGAQELGVFAGQARLSEPRQSSPAWELAYSRDIAPHVFGSVVYINEGHFVGHHRDGGAIQIGVRSSAQADGFGLFAAVGPYRYFDTTLAENGDGFADAHGTGMVYSVGAHWRRRQPDPWSWQLRVDRIAAPHGIDTTLVMAGAAYRLRQDASFAREGAPRGNAARDEVVVSLGQTIVNSFESEQGNAHSVDYRHAFTPVLRASVGWLNEGDARLIRRNGIVAQGWLEPTFFDGRFSLGIGFGPYFAIDHYREDRDVLGLLSTTASYRFGNSWSARFTWHRGVSRWDRDSDILLLGAGYRF
jgi:hypothetical protein